MGRPKARKGGRPKQTGDRYPGGKLKPLFDRGSERVITARDRFASFHNGKADHQVSDAIGRAWCVGLLENDRVDPAVLRDAGREYAAAYWGYYQDTRPSIGSYEGRRSRTTVNGAFRDPMGEAFLRMDRALSDAGYAAREAAQSLCVDQHFFPDDDPAWVARLINERLLRARKPVAGQLPVRCDYTRLANALAGLMAMV